MNWYEKENRLQDAMRPNHGICLRGRDTRTGIGEGGHKAGLDTRPRNHIYKAQQRVTTVGEIADQCQIAGGVAE